MNTFNTNEMNQQVDNLFMAPARAFATLSLNFTEKLVNAQLDAGKTYADTSLAQVRNLLSIKNAEGLRSYMEDQQKVAKELTERVKGDADKVASLHQDFIQQSQKLTESNVKQAREVASKATAKSA
ncbi:phasin family protein [Halomonas sediminis]|uniref:Phasin family protein n=1 Tax=Vreelandella zhuhanensis TaxID=2684210 RepID=A0A7X3H0J3_9GAMM|nr:phasin family protein [Halomonas zhuhanensis]MWJ28292.1 phasin family protein [Halomonas zhuhanensis]